MTSLQVLFQKEEGCAHEIGIGGFSFRRGIWGGRGRRSLELASAAGKEHQVSEPVKQKDVLADFQVAPGELPLLQLIVPLEKTAALKGGVWGTRLRPLPLPSLCSIFRSPGASQPRAGRP